MNSDDLKKEIVHLVNRISDCKVLRLIYIYVKGKVD